MTGTHPALAAQLVAVVDALLLRQRESLPPLVEVTEASIEPALKHTACVRRKHRVSRTGRAAQGEPHSERQHCSREVTRMEKVSAGLLVK